MALMRHSDPRLTDRIYTDENLLGTWSAFDQLPTYSEQASQTAWERRGSNLVGKIRATAYPAAG